MAAIATKVRCITGIYAKLQPPSEVIQVEYRHGTYFRPGTPEYRAEVTRSCEAWAAEIEKWKRDHGSRDEDTLSFPKVVIDVCSNCDEPWKTIARSGVVQCSSCGAPIGKC